MKPFALALTLLSACSPASYAPDQLDCAVRTSRDYGQRLAEVELLMALKRREGR